MLVAIISDIHNNEVNLKKVLDYCSREKIEKIICCGDLASMETLDFLNDNFSGEIFYTFGNMDNGQMKNYDFAESYKKTKIYKDFGEIEIENKRIAFVHFPKVADELAKTGKYNFVFYGHTHKPWTSTEINAQDKKCVLLNPGNVTGDFYPPTFAFWNTENDKFNLIKIHDLK